ncbi:MAG: hypothetical protein H6713_24600 [Myxococcales bacterium]|nr:hypothetical protein [Myxococcales bacterium]
MKDSWLGVLAALSLSCAAGADGATGEGTTGEGTTSGATTSSTTSAGASVGASSTGAATSSTGDASSSVGTSTSGEATSATTSAGTSGTSVALTGTTTSDGGFCGDGELEAPAEECDDGNSINGDGCNDDCQVSGKLIWSDLHNGAADNNDEALDVAVDGDGAIYLVGAVNDAIDARDIWARKYNADSSIAWSVTQAGTQANTDLARGVAVAADGSVYAAGYIRVVDVQAADVWLRKYDAAGVELWTQLHHDAVGAGDDAAFDVALDTQENVIVSAHSRTATLTADVWLRKYSSEGTTLWTRTHNGAANKGDHGRAVAIDAGDNVYVAGTEGGADNQSKAWLRKYDTDGNELWTRTWGPDNTFARLEAAAAAAAGAVFVAGYQNPGGVNEMIARRYSSAGDLEWTFTAQGEPALGAEARGIAVDADGRVIVTGHEVTDNGNRILIIKLDGDDGSILWEQRLYNASASNDIAFAVTTTVDLEIIVAGRYRSDGTLNDVWVGRFTP